MIIMIMIIMIIVQEWAQRSLNEMVNEIQQLKKANKILKDERDLALEQSSSSSQLRYYYYHHHYYNNYHYYHYQ